MTESFEPHIEQFQATYAAFLHDIANLPASTQDVKGACGEWSVKEVLDHLSGWLIEAQRRFKRFPTGTGNFTYDVDAFNTVSLWLRANQSFESSLAEVEAEAAKLMTMAREVTEVQRTRSGTRYLEWINAMERNAREHHAEILAWYERIS